jgi:gliding motility-associated-like protein
VILTAAGGTSYQWLRNDSVVVGATDSVLTVSTAASWSVIATNTFGCRDTSGQVSTIVNPLPTPTLTAGGTTTFCFGDSVVLSAAGGTSYQWLRNDSVVVGATDSVLTVSTAASWSVIATNTFGCSDTSSQVSTTVNPLPTPTVTAGGTTTFCFGDSVILAASGGTSYQWLRNDTLINSATDSVLTVSTAASWSVIATNTFGCRDTSAQVSTTVNPLPEAEITLQGQQNNCDGDSALLMGSNSNTYQWLRNGLPIIGAQSRSYTALTSGSYSLVVYNATGCSDTAANVQLNFFARPHPIVQFLNPPIFCQGDTVIMFTMSAQNYQWFRDGIAITGATDSFYTSTTAGLYSVQIINANGCQNISPQAATQVLTNTNNFRILANTVIVCAGDSALLEINAVVNTNYQWLKDGVAIPFATQTRLIVTTSGLYSCLITYNQRCNQEVNGVYVNVNPIPPMPIASANGPICRYTDLKLFASMVPNASYIWNGPAGFFSTSPNPVLPSIGFHQAGWYKLRINVNGCHSYEDSVYVGVQYEIPKLEIQGRRTYCPSELLKLNADSILQASYRWFLPSGDTIASRLLRLPLNEAADAESYVLEVRRGGCVDYYTEIIRVISLELIFPTAFTPNGDGLNEIFFPVGNYQGEYELEIYDRWGKKIFHSFRPEDGWDGTVYGSITETGTYSYVYRYEDCSNRAAIGKGSIQLIR